MQSILQSIAERSAGSGRAVPRSVPVCGTHALARLDPLDRRAYRVRSLHSLPFSPAPLPLRGCLWQKGAGGRGGGAETPPAVRTLAGVIMMRSALLTVLASTANAHPIYMTQGDNCNRAVGVGSQLMNVRVQPTLVLPRSR